jgi:diacylglycerol kinase family enzyme
MAGFGVAACHLLSRDSVKVAVIMNAGAGSIGQAKCEARAAEVREAFAAAGVEAEVHLCEGARLGDTARQVASRGGIDAVVAAGGDGTVSAVAGALVGGDIPMAVLPLGTLNHFARDIGMPDDLGEATRMIAMQQLRRVDVGEVNGHCFVNNSSIGLYPEIVLGRDAVQQRRGWGKWRAMAVAAWRVLRRFPLMFVRVVTPARALAATTPFVFIGNNEYSTNPLSVGQRARVDAGTLSLYMVRARGRLRMFWLMVRALMQRLDAVDDFEAEAVTEATVRLGRWRRHLRVALDGEVMSLTAPLHYRTRPGALAVLGPPAAEAAA